MNLNSNSTFAHNEGGPRIFKNCTANSHLVDPEKMAALNGNECGEKLMTLGVADNDVIVMVNSEDNKELKVNSQDEANSEEVFRGSPQINSGNCLVVALASRNYEDVAFRVQKGEQLGNGASVCLSSRSRTKTAQLSGNGYSEEVAKLYQSGLPDAGEEENRSNSASGVTIWM